MRELVYLSGRKLSTFVPSRTRFGVFRRVRELEVNIPFGLGAKAAFSESMQRQFPELQKVIDHIDQSGTVRWYEEAELKPGDWIQFETRLNYRTYEAGRGSGRRALIFWDVPDGPPGMRRILLHGSPDHLLGQVTPTLPASPAESLLPSTLYGFFECLSPEDTDELRENSDVEWQIPKILNESDRKIPAQYAAPMAGYAKVTGKVDALGMGPVLLASPLYVESIHGADALA